MKYTKIGPEDLITQHIDYLPAIRRSNIANFYGDKKITTYHSEKSYTALMATDTMINSCIFLCFNHLWQFAVTIAILSMYIIFTYIVVLNTNIKYDAFTVVFMISMYLINVFDTVCAGLHFVYDTIRKTKLYPRKNCFLMYTDILINIICLPAIVWAFISEDKLSQILFIVFGIIPCLFRFHRVYSFFRLLTNSPLRQGGGYVAMKLSLLIIFIVHTASCGWNAVGCFTDDCRKKGKDHWTDIFVNYHIKPEAFEKYVYGVFYAFGAAANLGLGNHSKKNDLEEYLTISMMLFGLFTLSGVFIGAFTTVQTEGYRQRQLFGNRLNLIVKELNHPTISPSLRKMITNFYYSFWQNEGAIADCNFVHRLPISLKKSLLLDKYWDALNRSHMFRFTPYGFKRELCLYMNTYNYNYGDVIYEQDQSKTFMVYVAQGMVQVLSPDDLESPLITFGVGSIIGDFSGIISFPIDVTIIAASYCTVHILSKQVLWDTARIYAKLKVAKSMHEVVRYVIKNAKTYKELKMDKLYFKNKSDKTLKYMKNMLQTKFIPITHLNSFKDVTFSQQELWDMYVLNKIEGSLVHRDIIFAKPSFPWLLNDETQLILLWESIIVIFSINVLIFYPFIIFFLDKFPYYYNFFMRPMAYVLYIADILVQMHTAGRNAEGFTVQSLSENAVLKLKTFSFIMDIVSILPLELVFAMLTNDFIIKLMQCNHLVKVIRVVKSFIKLSNSFKINTDILRKLLYAVYLLYLSYVLGIIYYVAGCPNRPCPSGTWIGEYIKNDNPLIKNTKKPNSDILIVSIFHGLLLLSATGGRIYTNQVQEVYIFTVFMVVATFVYTYLVADYSATLTLSRLAKDNFVDNVNTMRKYMITNNINLTTIHRMDIYFEGQWDYMQGTSLKNLMYDIPRSLFEKHAMDRYMYLLKSCELFHEFDKSMLKTLAGRCVFELYPPNEFVANAGVLSSEMFIIEKGFVEIIIPSSKRVEKILGVQSSMNVIDMLFELPTYYHIKTQTNVSLLKVSIVDFKYTIAFNKQLQSSLKSLIEEFKNAAMVRRLFNYRPDITSNSYITDANPSFFIFPTGKLDPLNIDFQKGWSGYNLLRMLLTRRTIMPNGKFLYFYTMFRALVAFIACTFYPPLFVYKSAFSPLVVYLITIPPDFLALVHIYVRMHICYYNVDGILVTHPRKTAVHYLTSSFFIDLLTALPWHLILQSLLRDKVLNILMFVKILQVYIIPYAFAYFERDFLKNQGIWANIMKYLSITLVFLNVLASILMLISTSFKRGANGRLIIVPNNHSFFFTKEESQISTKYGANEPFKNYCLALYYIAVTCLQSGYGDVTAIQNNEIFYVLSIILVGYLWTTYILVMVSKSKGIINISLMKYQEHMKELILYMRRENIPKRIQTKTIGHFEHLWQRTNGTRASAVLETFHTTLKEDCVLNLYFATLSQISIFALVDKSFYRVLSMNIDELFFLQNSSIIHVNDLVDTVYIIHRGEVIVKSPDGTVLDVLKRGAVFGNLDNVLYIRSMIDVISSNTVDILHIKSCDFYKILTSYPIILQALHVTIVTKNTAYIKQTEERYTTQSMLMSTVFGESNIALGTQRKLTKGEKFLKSRFMELITMLLALTSFVTVCYHVAFQSDNPHLILLLLTYTLDALHLCLIIIGFYVPFVSRLGELITNRKMIKNRYIHQTRFIIDVIGIMPFDIFAICFSDKKTFWFSLSLFRLNRGLRVLNIRNFFSITRDILNVKVLQIKMFSVFTYFLIYSHANTCIWYTLGCPRGNCWNSSWNHAFGTCNTPYLCTMYFTTSMCTYTGYTSLVPRSVTEVLLCIATLIISKFLISIFIGDMAAIVRHYGYNMNIYAHELKLLIRFLRNANISVPQRHSVLYYAENLWISKRGRQLPAFIETGPYLLIGDIKVHAYGHHIYDNAIFSGCHTDFLRILIGKLKLETYFENQKICEQGDVNNTIYFIHRGSVNVVSISDTEETIVDVLQEPDCYGMIQGLFPFTPHTHTIITTSITVIVTLKLNDWAHALRFFPSAKFHIYNMLNYL